jgi:hypothetical protein
LKVLLARLCLGQSDTLAQWESGKSFNGLMLKEVNTMQGKVVYLTVILGCVDRDSLQTE